MPEYNEFPHSHQPAEEPHVKEKNSVVLPVALFLVTLCTTSLAGLEWQGKLGRPIEFSELVNGLPYSLSLLLFLASHEFGHYFASMHHKVRASLPYFIPFISFEGFFLNFGTMGAVIRMKGYIPTRKALFDIGASGPIAGFVACLIILIYGFTHLPGKEYILAIHPDYFSPEYGKKGVQLIFGDTLMFSLLRTLFTHPGQFVPPMSEIYHYPFLCTGWFGLFVTSMNMIPVGQLDGGHVVYAMFGEKNHTRASAISLIILFIMGVFGIFKLFVFPKLVFGWPGWLFWALILFFLIKMKHPPVYDPQPLNRSRLIAGYIALVIFALSFSPVPFNIDF